MKTLMRSPAGGCVTVAVTRQDGGVRSSPGSSTATSIVVSGNTIDRRLSHERTGSALTKTGFGMVNG